MKTWYQLGLSLLLMGICACHTLSSYSQADHALVGDVYRQAFDDFSNKAYYPKKVLKSVVLLTDGQSPLYLQQMAEQIEKRLQEKGISTQVSVTKRRQADANLNQKIAHLFVGKFNPNAIDTMNNSLSFARRLTFEGHASMYTRFNRGDGSGKSFQKIYLVATIIQAKCGMSSCFSQLQEQIEWKLVMIDEPYLAQDQFLRLAQIAAYNMDFDKAESYYLQGKTSLGQDDVRRLIDEQKLILRRIRQSQEGIKSYILSPNEKK